VALGAGVLGVVLMAGSFGGTRSAGRLRRLIAVSALNLHSQSETSNIFLEKMPAFKGGGLKFPGHVRVLFPSVPA
jgi:hypothetical protein